MDKRTQFLLGSSYFFDKRHLGLNFDGSDVSNKGTGVNLSYEYLKGKDDCVNIQQARKSICKVRVVTPVSDGSSLVQLS